jgi:hypothetical protein
LFSVDGSISARQHGVATATAIDVMRGARNKTSSFGIFFFRGKTMLFRSIPSNRIDTHNKTKIESSKQQQRIYTESCLKEDLAAAAADKECTTSKKQDH